jgi:DNA-binding transcriptional regulator GbsR (MarR family)
VSDQNQVLKEATTQFVELWSDMATAWGINRTMAQIHALLYAEARPMNTDDLMERLSISRGNANMNLRELLQWNLIYKEIIPGDRKDYYIAETEVWTIVSRIVHERQEREITPVLNTLRETIQTLEKREDRSTELTEFQNRITHFVDFLEMFERFTHAMLPYITKQNVTFLKQMVRLAEAGQVLRSKVIKPDKDGK